MKRERRTLIWDDWNVEHIKKHNVVVKEVEEAVKSSSIQTESYDERVVFLGITKKGRLLTVVCSQAKQKDLYVVSARDMSKKERKYYYEQTKTD